MFGGFSQSAVVGAWAFSLIAQFAFCAEVVSPRTIKAEVTSELPPPRKAPSDIKFTPFSQLGPRCRLLTVQRVEQGSDLSLDSESEGLLQARIRYFISALRAPSFDEFKICLQANSAGMPFPKSYQGMRARLISTKLIEGEAQYSDDQIFEIYWCSHTDFGHGENFYTDIALSESYYQLFTITAVAELEKPILTILGKDISNSGALGKTSMFDYGFEPSLILKRGGTVKSAIVTLHFRLRPGASFPILIWFLWDKDAKAWIPMQVAELAVRNRFFPLF